MTPLEALAQDAGIAVQWTGADRQRRRVPRDTLHAVLRALGLPAGTGRQITDSRALLAARERQCPLQVIERGGKFAASGKRLQLVAEDGTVYDLPVSGGAATAALPAGYYQFADSSQRLAVAPSRAFPPAARMWGVSAQLYALRGSPDFGDFGALGAFCEEAAGAGADAVLLSPVHALPKGGISPYSPASRLFLDPLYIPRKGRDGADALIDWPRATRRRLEDLRGGFQQFERNGGDGAFDDFVRRGGAALRHHAHAEGETGADERFQLYLQWQADQALASAQARARAAGMDVGLISDVAVGVTPGGSEAAGNLGMLQGLTIGAPPDAFNTQGQNWGLTSFSPDGLRASGYAGFLEMLRAAMRHAGGIRLDHAMGLTRLWVVPEGEDARRGAYLHYPFEALLGLLCLESQRHRALVIGEDLGTVPRGFRSRLHRAGILGMNVLWFARDAGGAFIPPARWPADNAALTSTHDLPTLAGWWQERDLDWQEKIGGRKQAAARKARARDKRSLCQALRIKDKDSGPSLSTGRFVDGVLKAMTSAPSPLVLVPVEDLVGEVEQPNIPGTVSEHPNWRRRLRAAQPFDLPAVRRRASLLNRP